VNNSFSCEEGGENERIKKKENDVRRHKIFGGKT